MHRNKTNAAHYNSRPWCMLLFMLMSIVVRSILPNIQRTENVGLIEFLLNTVTGAVGSGSKGLKADFPQWDPPKREQREGFCPAANRNP